MVEYCKNHPTKKAISFCHSCKQHYCEDCLEEGVEYWFCKSINCLESKLKEAKAHDDVKKSKGTDTPLILIDGKTVGFCNKCINDTSSHSISKADFSIRNAMLVNERDKCETCGSVIMDLKKPIFFLFWSVFGTYRVIKMWDLDPDKLNFHRDKYISRKILQDTPQKNNV